MDAGGGLLHDGGEGDLLGPELRLDVLALLASLSEGLGLATLGEADIGQSPPPLLPGGGAVDAVDELLLGDAEGATQNTEATICFSPTVVLDPSTAPNPTTKSKSSHLP